MAEERERGEVAQDTRGIRGWCCEHLEGHAPAEDVVGRLVHDRARGLGELLVGLVAAARDERGELHGLDGADGARLGQIAQAVQEIVGGLDAGDGALLQELAHELLERERGPPPRAGDAHRRDGVAHVRARDAERVVAGEGRGAGDALVEQDPEGVEIGAVVDLAPGDLLGGHVFRRTCDVASVAEAARGAGDHLSREAEIEDAHRVVAVVAGGQHDVVGLEIAVNEAAPVSRAEAPHDLRHHEDRLGARQAGSLPAQALAERLAREQLHRDVAVRVGPGLDAAVVVDGDDVGVVDLRGEAGLAKHPLAIVGGGAVAAACLRGDDLERDEAAQGQVFGLVDDAHAPVPQRAREAVASGDDVIDGEGERHDHDVS
ncbi:MAG: hypothetical protein R3B70_15565 [Polyangiaceae bacterium]